MRTRRTGLSVLAAVAVVLAGSSPAQAADSNVALNALATATTAGGLPAAQCTLGSGPAKAVDGRASNIYTDKWCVPSGTPTLTIQLPKTLIASGYLVNKIVVKHAGFAGENPAYNTRAFSVNVRRWQPCSGQVPILNTPQGFGYVTNNTANQTVFSASYMDNVDQVQLVIQAPTQGTGGATRIYEVEVWGTPSANNLLDNCYNPFA